MRMLVSVLLAVFLSGIQVSAQPADDYQIVPGERIGPVRIGMTITDVVKVLGTPKPAVTKITSIVLPVPEGATVFDWEPSPEAERQGAKVQGFSAVTDREGNVYEVQGPFDNRYHTAQGIHIGNTMKNVEAVFGTPSRDVTPAGGHERFYVYDQNGIVFLVQNSRQADNYGLVNGVWVFAPR